MEFENPNLEKTMEQKDIPAYEAAPLTLASEINDFVRLLPYWGQHIARVILTTGNYALDDIKAAYDYFLEDSELAEKKLARPIFTFEDAPLNNSTYKGDLKLTSLSKVEGVNALAENQIIEFHPNLTIIYGTNGSGKSGYIRLLKKVFFSRSAEDIIGNIHFEGTNKPINADFTFRYDEATETLNYPDDARNPIFRQYCVFDEKSIPVHLNQRNQFEFRPAGLNFFSKLISAFKDIESKLNAETTLKNTLINYAALFEGESPIRTLLDNLDDKKILDKLKKHLPYSEKDKEDCKKLEEQKLTLAALKKDKEIAGLNEKKQLIANCKTVIEGYNKWFSADSTEKIKQAIESNISTKEIAAKEGVANFKFESIKDIGGKEWKAFIEAANKFALKQEGTYPAEDATCLFCYQPLSDDAKNLVSRYWVFIKSTAEKNASDAQKLVDTCIGSLEKLNFQILAEDSILHKWMGANYATHLEQLNSEVIKQKELATQVITDLKNSVPHAYSECLIQTTTLDNIVAEIEAKIKEFVESNTNKDIERINQELTYFEHKRKLDQHFNSIEKHLTDKLWCALAAKASKNLNSRKITDKEKALSAKYFNQVYVDTFNKECADLRADFGIDISHTGSLGTSFKQLLYKNYAPSAVLSIGEQKVISIADFLSEIQISDINKGIIFDDPVSSLDDERKTDIADRLVLESQKRQVIIFTHDLMFVSSLILSSETRKVAFDCHWIENADKTPGVVWLRNTPVFEKSYKKSGKAQEYYDAAKKAGPEERESKIKNGFAALRTSYEALVIFELFSGVVQRFNERVSVDSLSSVYFDQKIKEEILDSFYKCCRYMEGHSHSDKYAYIKPTLENLNEEIQRFNATRKNLTDLKIAQQKAL